METFEAYIKDYLRDKYKKKDVYLNPQQALEHGLIDKIL